MMQEAPLDTLALAGAMVAALFAALTFAFASRRDATPWLVWWAAAFAVEALRLAWISAANDPLTARGELIGTGSHAFVAMLVLIGALGFLGEEPRTRRFQAAAGLSFGTMLLGLLDPRVTASATGFLTALAAGALAVAAWLFWRHHRAKRRACDLIASIVLVLLMLHLLDLALVKFGIFAATEPRGMGEWHALAHLGLSILTMTCLVFAAQYQAFMIRFEAEDELAASEQRFRDFAEVAGDWIWETGPDLRYTYFSDRLQDAIGVDPRNLLGRTRRELLDGDPQDPDLCNHLADLDARRPFRDFEFACRPDDGSTRHLRISGKPVFDARGTFIGYRGTGTDVTAEVEAKSAAARFDRCLRDAVESLPYGLALFDADDRLILCNSEHRHIYPGAEGIMVPGRRFEEILWTAAERGLYSAEGEELETLIQDCLTRHRNPPKKPFHQTLSDGRVVRISESRTADGGFVTAWSDITGLKRREQALAVLVESDLTERSFFDVAAEALAIGLGCRWSGITRLRDGGRFESLATRGPGLPHGMPSHGLDVTPGGAVVESRGYLSFADGVAERFPDDTILAELGVVSYQGHAVLDAEGTPLGHLFAMNDRPDTPGSSDRELVGLIARWVGMEFQRKHAEAALHESQHRFQDYAETGADWFWETDMEQRFTSFTESGETTAAAHITIGMTREEILRRVNAEPDITPIVAEYMAKGQVFRNLEFRCDSAKLGTRWVRISGKPVRAADGRLVGYRGTDHDITKHKRAEAALRRSEASLANAQRIAQLGNWDWNIVTNELHWSDEVYRIFGLEPNAFEVTYDAFLSSIHAEDRPLVEKAVTAALAGFPFGIDHRIVLPGGGVRIVHEQGEVELDEAGTAVFLRGTVQDVTAHREAVAAVREGERHVRAIMENVADALMTIDERGLIQSVNPATERLFGYETDELIGENASVLMAAPDRIEHDNYLRHYLATGRSKILGIGAREVVGRRKDGAPVDIELTVGEMRSGGGRLFVGAMRDITERKRAEEELRQKSAFVELSKSAAAAANEALTVEQALQTCVSEVCLHFGWPVGHAYLPAEDGTGELASSAIWHLDDRDKFNAFCSITTMTRFTPGVGLPGRILAAREPIWIADVTKDTNFLRAGVSQDTGIKAAFGFPVLVGSEVAAVLEFFAEDAIETDQAALEVMAHIGKQIGRVIERAHAEDRLHAAKEAAEGADRVKGEFLATMSHELRTPLNAIIGFSEIIGQELFGPIGHPNYKEYVADIQTSGTHLLNIINDILDVSKAEAGMFKLSDDSVDLAEIIETSLRLLGPRAEDKGLAFEIDVPATPVRIRGDRQRLNQILRNLVSNAVKFTLEGSITVRLRGDQENGVVLQIIDTGIGIAEHDLKRVMEPFTQADSTLSRSHEGTGLGLSLSHALVEAHGGQLSLDSTIGEGTTVTVRLPARRVLGGVAAA